MKLFTVVTRKEADIKGKKINVGNPGSGQASTAATLFPYLSMKKSNLHLLVFLKLVNLPMH
jgi:TRAP-type uncharacterized transport system substrate-binding protein